MKSAQALFAKMSQQQAQAQGTAGPAWTQAARTESGMHGQRVAADDDVGRRRLQGSIINLSVTSRIRCLQRAGR